MTDNTDKLRALKAEKQVERLERELELIKSRIKKPTNGSASPTLFRDSDKLTFQLQEQVKDLKYQLKNQVSENTKLQDTLNNRTTEYEEKLKRMREIFGQASRNIDNYRASIASKDVEIQKLNVQLQECQSSEQSCKSTLESHQLTIERLNSELTSKSSFYGTEIKQLEAKTRQLSIQLDQTRSDYDQYKKRAHGLLEKNKDQISNVSKMNDLVEQLQTQKTKYELDQQEKLQQVSLLEHDLCKAIDRIQALEMNQNALNRLNQTYITEKKNLESKIQSLNTTITQLTLQLDKQQKEHLDNQQEFHGNQQEFLDQTQQIIEYKLRIHELEETNDSLYQQILLKDNEIEKLIISTPSSPPPTDELTEIPSNHNNNDVYASMSSLLSPLVSRQIPGESTGLENQVQRLSEMLHESEDKVAALKSQEKILKDELRKMDAIEKRQDMNVEYLKNVLVKFLMAENKKTMVPILAKLLYLDETEKNNLMENCM